MPLPKRQGVSNGRPSNKPTIADPRFSNIETDPRFRLPSKKHAKTRVDERFSRMLKDDDFTRKATVDRYGRKIDKDAGRKDLERFYRLDDEDEGSGADDDDEEDDHRDQVVRRQLAKVEARGNKYDPIRDGGISSSDESSSDEEEEEEEEEDIEDEAEVAEQGGEVPTGEVTARLAAVNLDWDNIRASDIMAVANSFVPADGRILSVIIYPSEFGQERLQREDIEGPPREIFASTTNKDRNNLTSLDEDASELSDSEEDEERIKKNLVKEGNGEEFDSKALRAYQLERLRYYYAVITCSKPGVAKALYDNMDGREYLSSANFFDLRFVPDGVTFDEDPHDECEELPEGYKPNEFSTDALTHSNVKLTWDADDTTRKEVQKRAFSRKEIDENDLQAYIGTDSSSEDEAADDKTAKVNSLRAALGLGAAGSAPPKTKVKSEKRDRDFSKPDGEMQITFSAALSSNAPKGSVFENDPDETTLEKYVRKQKERKQKRRARAQAIKEGRDPDAIDAEGDAAAAALAEEDEGFNDPFFGSDPESFKPTKSQLKKSNKAKRREEQRAQAEQSATQRAELELLMVDDKEASMRHFDMNDIAKAEKAAKKGKKKGKKAKDDNLAVQDNFKMDTQDPRFAKLFESHEFAIDPTNPRFKGTEGMKALLEEGRKKRKRDRGVDGEEGSRKKKDRKADANDGGDDLKKLAAKVKARSTMT